MYNGIENDSISQLIKDCSPLKIKVKVETVDNCVVIYFDGRNSYADNKTWDLVWGGFSAYINLLMNIHGVYCFHSDKIEENYYSANLGSLFDMIRRAAENE